MRYLMLHCIDESVVDWNDDGSSVDPEEDRAVEAWDVEMKERGILVGGGFLRPTSDATTVKVRDGRVLVADGPFAETKEQIAGVRDPGVRQPGRRDRSLGAASDRPDRDVRAAPVLGVARRARAVTRGRR